MRNRKSIYTVITLLFAIGFYIYDNYSFEESSSTITSENNLNLNFLPTSTTNNIVHHNFYSLSYHEKYEQAEWVAYELTKTQITKTNFKRR